MPDTERLVYEALQATSNPIQWTVNSLVSWNARDVDNPLLSNVFGGVTRKLLRRLVERELPKIKSRATVSLGTGAPGRAQSASAVVPVVVSPPAINVKRAVGPQTGRAVTVPVQARVPSNAGDILEELTALSRREVPQTAVAKPAPVLQPRAPVRRANLTGERAGMAVRINPTTPPGGGPMDLGDALVQLGSSYISTKYAGNQNVDFGGFDIPLGLPGVEVVGDPGDTPGAHYLRWDKRTQTWVPFKRRSRQRKLITDSNMTVLNNVQASLGALSPSQAKLMLPLYLKAMR